MKDFSSEQMEEAGSKVGGVYWVRLKVAKRAKVVKRTIMTFMLAFQFPTERLIVMHLFIPINYTTVFPFPRTDHISDKYSIYFQ